MPAPEITARFQKAVLLRFAGYNNYGVPIVDDPIELDVRWENVRKSMQDAQGNPIAIEAEVVVNQEIAIGSGMWLGSLADWPGEAVINLMYVKLYNAVPDIKGRKIRRTVSLMKWQAGLPQQSVGSGTG